MDTDESVGKINFTRENAGDTCNDTMDQYRIQEWSSTTIDNDDDDDEMMMMTMMR